MHNIKIRNLFKFFPTILFVLRIFEDRTKSRQRKEAVIFWICWFGPWFSREESLVLLNSQTVPDRNTHFESNSTQKTHVQNFATEQLTCCNQPDLFHLSFCLQPIGHCFAVSCYVLVSGLKVESFKKFLNNVCYLPAPLLLLLFFFPPFIIVGLVSNRVCLNLWME